LNFGDAARFDAWNKSLNVESIADVNPDFGAGRGRLCRAAGEFSSGHAILGESQPNLWKAQALRQNVRIQAHETDRVSHNVDVRIQNVDRVVNNGNRVAKNGNVELQNVDVARHNANMRSQNGHRGPYEVDRV
jgi:hypothetical protein